MATQGRQNDGSAFETYIGGRIFHISRISSPISRFGDFCLFCHCRGTRIFRRLKVAGGYGRDSVVHLNWAGIVSSGW